MRALIAIAALALAGCATTATAPRATVSVPVPPAWVAPQGERATFTAGDVAVAISAVRPGVPVDVTDAAFTAVDHAWLERMVAWSDSFLRATSKVYTPESFDCDKFAKAFTLGVEWVASDAGVRAQPLVARLYVLLPTGGAHAVVGFRSERGLFVLEPQPGGVGPRLVPLADYRPVIFRVRLGG